MRRASLSLSAHHVDFSFRRLDAVTRETRESSSVRRSPRLSGRFSNYRDDGGITHRSTYTTSTVSSRPSLRGFGTNKKKVAETSILNESGQSVLTSFGDAAGSHRKSKMPEHLFGK